MHHSPQPNNESRSREGYSWKRVCELEQVPENTAIERIVGRTVVALFRQPDRIYAMDGMCSHQGGPIAQGRVEHGCVTCPWHGWQYELETGIQTINRQPLQECFDTREVDGWIEIFIGE